MRKIIPIIIFIITLFVISGCTEYIDNDPTFQDKFDNLQGAYKSALLATGKNQMDAGDKFADFEEVWDGFYAEYESKAVNEYSNEVRWKFYMKEINKYVKEGREAISEGNIALAHESLEKIRDTWQKLFERNEVDNMMYRMTDFHTTMEETYDLVMNNASISEVRVNCGPLRDKWKEILNFEPEDKKNRFNELYKGEMYNLKVLCGDVTGVPLKDAIEAVKVGYSQMYAEFD